MEVLTRFEAMASPFTEAASLRMSSEDAAAVAVDVWSLRFDVLLSLLLLLVVVVVVTATASTVEEEDEDDVDDGNDDCSRVCEGEDTVDVQCAVADTTVDDVFVSQWHSKSHSQRQRQCLAEVNTSIEVEEGTEEMSNESRWKCAVQSVFCCCTTLTLQRQTAVLVVVVLVVVIMIEVTEE